MRHLSVIALSALSSLAAPAVAGNLVCAEDSKTFAHTCFRNDGVRKNGEVRAAKLYRGGPNNIEETGYTARVHCQTNVLELTDRQGVAFARNVPQEQSGKDFVRFLCAHATAKDDPKLRTR